MKKYFSLIILGVIITSSVQSQKVVKKYYDWAQTQLKQTYTVNATGQINGVAKTYTENGVLSEEATFKNNRLDGVYKKYNVREELSNTPQANRIYEICTYKNGEKDGTETTYDFLYNGKTFNQWLVLAKNDNTHWDGESAQNVKNSLTKGKRIVLSETKYKEGGLLSKIEYYTNGKVKNNTSYLSGYENKVMSYYENGSLMREENVTNGFVKTFYLNGKPKLVYKRSNGLIDSLKSLFDEDGKLIASGMYKNGYKDGEFKVLYTEKGSVALPKNGNAVFTRIVSVKQDQNKNSENSIVSQSFYLTGEKLDEAKIINVTDDIGVFDDATQMWDWSESWKAISSWNSSPYISYYKNGNKKQEGALKRNGTLVYIMVDGELELDLKAMDNNDRTLDGTWKFYDKEGNLLREEKFSESSQW